MDELSSLKQENKKLKSQISVLEQELQQYTEEGPNRFKYELNRFVNNATIYIKKKSGNIAELAGATEGKEFDRLMALIKHTKDATDTIAAMDSQGIIDNKGKDEDDVPFAESIAEKRN